jgi:methionyl-tRNA formyltransferase
MRSSVGEACRALEVPFRTVQDVNDPEFVDFIRAQGIDVIVSFQQRIFRKPLLDAPHIACLNVHTGLLPGYRGSNQSFGCTPATSPSSG